MSKLYEIYFRSRITGELIEPKYVGETIQDLKDRFDQHTKYKKACTVYKFLQDNPDLIPEMVLTKQYKKELKDNRLMKARRVNKEVNKMALEIKKGTPLLNIKDMETAKAKAEKYPISRLVQMAS